MNRWNSDIDALPIHSGSSHFQFSSASGRLHAMTKRSMLVRSSRTCVSNRMGVSDRAGVERSSDSLASCDA